MNCASRWSLMQDPADVRTVVPLCTVQCKWASDRRSEQVSKCSSEQVFKCAVQVSKWALQQELSVLHRSGQKPAECWIQLEALQGSVSNSYRHPMIPKFDSLFTILLLSPLCVCVHLKDSLWSLRPLRSCPCCWPLSSGERGGGALGGLTLGQNWRQRPPKGSQMVPNSTAAVIKCHTPELSSPSSFYFVPSSNVQSIKQLPIPSSSSSSSYCHHPASNTTAFLFRWDSISWHLPLSVSEWFIVSDWR